MVGAPGRGVAGTRRGRDKPCSPRPRSRSLPRTKSRSGGRVHQRRREGRGHKRRRLGGAWPGRQGGVSLGQGVASTGRVNRGREAAVYRDRRGVAEAVSTSVVGTDVATRGGAGEGHGRGAGVGCRGDRRGHDWRRRGRSSSGQAWDEPSEATAAEEAETAPTKAKEPRSAMAEEA